MFFLRSGSVQLRIFIEEQYYEGNLSLQEHRELYEDEGLLQCSVAEALK